MTKNELDKRVDAAKATTKEALQIVIDELNQGQVKKITKNDAVKELLDFYGIEY